MNLVQPRTPSTPHSIKCSLTDNGGLPLSFAVTRNSYSGSDSKFGEMPGLVDISPVYSFNSNTVAAEMILISFCILSN